ncbi:MAG: hypothetical protein HC851_11575 [Acaryochloris sp. RU_4_1]|nr:hypothetical protein [Acaryochloris sp. RU_4_1]NJR54862.1 hypothetical protein [Acaryochloris sp. CRU_2_0]
MIVCQVPKPGSFSVPFFMSTGESVLEAIEHVFVSIQDGEMNKILDTIPDEKLRNRVLLEVRKFLPKAGEGWRFGFQRSGHQEIVLTADKAAPLIDRVLSQDNAEDTVMTVTGELIRIDFDKRTVVLRYPPTHQEIECTYVDELEETMLDNRRELSQATGKFTLDSEGNPIKLTDVIRLDVVDLSPLNIREFTWKERQFVFPSPLVLEPYLDQDSQQLLVIDKPKIGLHVFAETRKQLIQEIAEQFAFMWDAYVDAPEDQLAPDALRLRHQLTEVVNLV